MPKPEDIFKIFGIVLLSLASIGLVSRTAKAILGRGPARNKTFDPVYDPDSKTNDSTRICPLEAYAFVVRYENTSCFGKTLIQWYVPWERRRAWAEFEKRNKERRRRKVALLQEQQEKKENVSTENLSDDDGEKSGSEKGKEKPSRVVYTILGALLIASSTVACWEVFKDKLKRRCSAEAEAKAKRDRRCSLADFTINRHLRRESRQAEMQQIQRQASFDRSSKVTQPLLRRGSLDRVVSEFGPQGKRRLLRTSLRRSSFAFRFFSLAVDSA